MKKVKKQSKPGDLLSRFQAMKKKTASAKHCKSCIC